MGILTFIALAAGIFLGGLVAVAMLVAGWELLRQREMLDQLRRDRAAFAATSPLPLMSSPAQLAGAAFARLTSAQPALAVQATSPGAATRLDPNWIETRPTVLDARACDNETLDCPSGLDLVLE